MFFLDIPNWLSDFLGLLASLVLMWPVFRINSIAKLIWRLNKVSFSSQSIPFLEEERINLIKNFNLSKNNWNKFDEICLYFGVSLLILSFALGLVSQL